MALFTTVIVVAVLKQAQEVFIPLALAILCTLAQGTPSSWHPGGWSRAQ
jgi:predicted PurR-regulated permease PerM